MRTGTRFSARSVRRTLLQLGKESQSFPTIYSAHLLCWSQAKAYGRPLWLTKQSTSHIREQLNTRDPRRFAVRHAGDRRGDRGRDATRATVGPAIHRAF